MKNRETSPLNRHFTVSSSLTPCYALNWPPLLQRLKKPESSNLVVGGEALVAAGVESKGHQLYPGQSGKGRLREGKTLEELLAMLQLGRDLGKLRDLESCLI